MGPTNRNNSGRWNIRPDHLFWLESWGLILLTVLLAPNLLEARRTVTDHRVVGLRRREVEGLPRAARLMAGDAEPVEDRLDQDRVVQRP